MTRDRRLVVLGGFLGAGKTTTLLALARRYVAQGLRVGIITNDQAQDLVDTATFRASGLDAAEVAGGCFCCRFDDFIARAEDLLARVAPDIILAEPVGSCTDLVATVLHPLAKLFPERFRIAPYVVLVDPLRALRVLGGTESVSLSEKVTYIYRMQQQEADVIAVTKTDLLSDQQRDEVAGLLRGAFPDRDVVMCSARTGAGMEQLASMLGSTGRHAHAVADLDYDAYAEGEAALGWLNQTLVLSSAHDVDIDTGLMRLGHEIHRACGETGAAIAHAKLMLQGSGRTAIVNIVDNTRAAELSRAAATSASALTLTLNLRVQAPPDALQSIVDRAIAAWAAGLAIDVRDRSGRAFSPARPVPTHRIPAADPV